MSTDYYLVCDFHKQIVGAASNTMGSAGCVSGDRELAAFVISHRDCSLRVSDEHGPELNSICYGEKTWAHWESKEIDHFLKLKGK